MMVSDRAEIHVYAGCVHGALGALHLLGVLYNVKRFNRFETIAHVLGVLFAIRNTRHHAKRAIAHVAA